MRARLLAAALLLTVAPAAFSQEEEAALPAFRKSYSIELGTGLPPLHMSLMPSRAVKDAYAQKGQSVSSRQTFYPVISLTGTVRTSRKSEHTLTAGLSWCFHPVTRYGVFGTDPDGKPRYDLSDGSPAGWEHSSPVFTFTWHWRHLWNPDGKVVAYSGVGAGFPFMDGLFPLPSVTPIAIRFGGAHLYGFAECTLGPVASILHAGLGWKF